jgi:hypothetical protein
MFWAVIRDRVGAGALPSLSRVITACTLSEKPFLADGTLMHCVKQVLVTRSFKEFFPTRQQLMDQQHNVWITFVQVDRP